MREIPTTQTGDIRSSDIDSTLCPTSKRILTHALRIEAATEHLDHPQYAGYFDSWTLHRVLVTTRFAGGGQIPAGRIVLANPSISVDGDTPTRAAYDPSTGHVVAFPTSTIRSL